MRRRLSEAEKPVERCDVGCSLDDAERWKALAEPQAGAVTPGSDAAEERNTRLDVSGRRRKMEVSADAANGSGEIWLRVQPLVFSKLPGSFELIC